MSATYCKAISHGNACTLFRRLAIPRDTVKTVRPEMQQPAGKEIRKRVEEQRAKVNGTTVAVGDFISSSAVGLL